ncbi:MAG: insulinase family protein [Candidatus Eremiobacterota bacterium]
MKQSLKIIALITCIVIVMSYGFAQEKIDLKQSLQWPEYILKGKLDNGIDYYIMEHKKPKNRITAWIAVRAGSLQETDKERGIAHYLEHMGFDGTKNFPPGELVKYFESIGTDMGPGINAYTSFDRTVYTIEVTDEKEEYLDKAITALCDYAFNMLLLKEQVDREKPVILEELRLGSDVDKRVWEKRINLILKDSLYPDRLPIGIKETIEKFSQEDFKRFYSTWYRPDLMSIVVVGDCKASEVEKKLKNTFSSVPQVKIDKPDLYVPFKPHKEIYTGVITDPELKATSISISYLRESEKTVTIEDYKRDVCDRLLFTMVNMRFSLEKYKLDTPLISASGYKSGWLRSLTEAGFSAEVNPGKSMKALDVMMQYIEGFRTHGFTDVERDEAQSQMLQNLRKAKEEKDTREAGSYISSIMSDLMHDSIYTSYEQDYELAQKLLPLITDEEINSRIKYLFEPVNMSVIIEGPPADMEQIKEEQVLSSVNTVIKSGGTPYKLEKINYSYDYSNLKSGEVLSTKEYKDPGITELKLSNGLTVLLKPTVFDKDTVYISYISTGGKLLEQADTPCMCDVAQIAWGKGGTEDLTQFEVERLLKGTNIRFSTGGSTLYGIHGNSAKSELEKLCQWMYQYMVRPGYREEGIAYGIKLVQDNIRYMSQYQEGAMEEAENKIFLPNSPLSVTATEEEVATYRDREKLKQFQSLSCVPSNSELIITGAFDPVEATALICKYFGSLPAGENPSVPYTYLRTEFPEGNTKRMIYRGMEDRCLITVLFPGCMKNDTDMVPLKVLARILDMRYWDKIRIEKSLAYSVWAGNISPLTIKGYGRVKLGGGCDPDKVDEVTACMMAEIRDIKQKGPEEEELESAKKILLKDYDEKLERNSFWIGEMQGSYLFNYDLEKALKNKDLISTIKAEEVKAAAIKYLDEKNNVIIIALPEEKISSEGDKQEE